MNNCLDEAKDDVVAVQYVDIGGSLHSATQKLDIFE